MLIHLLLLLTLSLCMSAKSECAFHDLKVHFESFNFNTILKWEAPENSKGLQYTVKYCVYGSLEWKKKTKCTKITRTWCDLSDEIHPEEEYIGKVIINKKNCSSTSEDRFNIKSNIEIGPPIASLFLNDTSIEISLAHPIEHRRDTFKGAKYLIYVNDAPPKESEEPFWSIKNTKPDTTYCVTAKLEWFNKISNPSNKTCIPTNADHRSQEIIAWMMGILSVTLIACTAILVVYATLKYIYGSNLRQPKILNITANNNAIVVDAGSATINLITIECAKPKVLDFVPSSKEDDEEFKKQANHHITDGKDLLNCDSEVIEEADEESDNDHGYVSLQEQVITPSPIISPYDMPHHLHEPFREHSTSPHTENEQRDAYGGIKNIASPMSAKENFDLEVVSKENTSEETIEKYPYVPHDPRGDSNFSKVNKSNTDVYKPEESVLNQELETVNMIEDTGHVESGMLFVDWSPDNPPIYLPNLSRKRALENCIKQCQQENECLLSQVYLPSEVKEASEDNELAQLEERWGLFTQQVE